MTTLVNPARAGRISIRAQVEAVFVTARAFLRGFKMLFWRGPATPLRVGCIVAIDISQRLCGCGRLSEENVNQLSVALDFAAAANAIVDNKPRKAGNYTRHLECLASVGLAETSLQYRQQLDELESRRPKVLGERSNFQAVAKYREAVVEVSMDYLKTILNRKRQNRIGLDECYATLCRLATLCQVVDDVLDYSRDLAAGLPGFLTAIRSQRESIILTTHYVRKLMQVEPTTAIAGSPLFRIAQKLLGMLALFLLSYKSLRYLGLPRDTMQIS